MARLVVVRMPEARRRHKHRVRVPVEPLAVGHVAVLIERLAHHRVAAGLGVDHQIHGDRLVAVRSLHSPHRQEPEHRPHHVGDRHRLREQAAAKQHAQPVGTGARGIVDHGVEGLEDRLAAVDRGRKSRLPRRCPEIPQQRFVVHPVEGGIFGGIVEGRPACGQREQVTRMPRKLPAVGQSRGPRTPHHEEEVRGGSSLGGDRLAGADMDEVRGQPGRRRRAHDPECRTRIERQDPGGTPLVKFGPPPCSRNTAQRPVGNRVGGVAVVVKPRGFREVFLGQRVHGVSPWMKSSKVTSGQPASRPF